MKKRSSSGRPHAARLSLCIAGIWGHLEAGPLGVAAIGMLTAGTATTTWAADTTLPSGAQVSAGAASIAQSGAAMTVTQSSQRAAINWQGFSIGKDASVTFVQPNANAVVLNRVTGGQQSIIDGALRANGQVFLLNPNGVLFSSSARVDTAGLVATTRSISDADFMAGKSSFSGAGAGDVVNAGSLNATEGGYVALIGRQVRNDGVISARLGTVALASGDRVSLNFDGNALVGVTIDQGTLNALVHNGGAVLADGGTVLLKASAAEGLLNTVVNNTGQIRAQSIGERNGKIVLLGEGGTVEVAGTLDASNTGQGNGGFIETSGPVVQIKDGTIVTTAADHGASGTWLIDPTDFEIAAGNAPQSASGIGAATLQAALASGNVTIQTQAAGTAAGDINVNSALAWNANLLTLEAYGDINVNAVMSASGTSTLNLKTGYNFNSGSPVFDASKTVRTKWVVDGNGNPSYVGRIDFDRTGTGVLTINNAGYTLINALGAAGSTTGTDLQGINGNLSGKYALAGNIDASATTGWGNWGSGNGFNPIGRTTGFTGVLDGLGHVVTGYYLNASANNLGLIGQLNGANAAVRNIGVTNIQVMGDAPPNFGGLVGLLNAGSVSNAFATGTMSAWAPQSGGLVGLAGAGTSISRSYAKVVIRQGAGDTGGLLGRAESGAVISDSSATADIEAPYGDNTGGLIGSINGATVTGSSATGTVTGTNNIGGLIGKTEGVSTVARSSSSGGTVSGANNVGGLIGNLSAGGSGQTTVSNSSSGNSVYANNSTAGGFVGVVDGSGSTVRPAISNSFAAGGTVTAPGQAGGFAGYFNVADLYDSYADMTVRSSQSGAFWFGGLFSRARNMIVERSYALGTLDLSAGTARYAGGLIGETINGTLTDVYARVDINAPNGRWVGGLVGFNSAAITNAYSTGSVIATTNVGGLIGASAGGSVNNSFWDTQTSGIGTAGSTLGSAGGTGKSTADMKDSSTYQNAGWNMAFGTGVWARRDSLNDGYAVLQSMGYTENIVVDLGVNSRQYGDANPSLAGATITGCPTLNCAGLIDGISWGSALGAGTATGQYALSAPGVLSYTFSSGVDASRFTISYLNPSFEIIARVPSTPSTPTMPATGASASSSLITNALTTAVGTAQRTAPPPAGSSDRVVAGGVSGAMPPNLVNPPSRLSASLGAGMSLAVLSAPSGGELSEGVSMSQLRQMVAGGAVAGVADEQDLRVPVSRNSLAQIVNGGVRLPSGVDQMMFVVNADK